MKRNLPLTPRQRAVLQGYADGLSNDAIASRMGITPMTARTHRQNALVRLHAPHTPAALARGFREGWLR
jgi:DNA-binding NarL/FixJ family response regulator